MNVIKYSKKYKKAQKNPWDYKHSAYREKCKTCKCIIEYEENDFAKGVMVAGGPIRENEYFAICPVCGGYLFPETSNCIYKSDVFPYRMRSV